MIRIDSVHVQDQVSLKEGCKSSLVERGTILPSLDEADGSTSTAGMRWSEYVLKTGKRNWQSGLPTKYQIGYLSLLPNLGMILLSCILWTFPRGHDDFLHGPCPSQRPSGRN